MVHRKMMAGPFALVLAALILMSSAPFLHAGSGNWWLNEQIQQRLDLSPEQVQMIGEVEGEFASQLQSMKAEKQTAYKNIIRLLDSENLSDEDFAKAQTRIETAYGKNAAASTERWKALRATMTLKQWKDLPMAAPRVLQLGSMATSFRGKVQLGEPPTRGK